MIFIERLRYLAPWYAAWVGAAVFAFLGLVHAFLVGLGYDSHAYWAAVQHMDHLYTAPALSRDAYLYSPAFAQVIWPLGLLPWPVFGVLWSAFVLAAFAWLLKVLPTRWLVPALVATAPEVVTGNIYAFMALAVVFGVSRGAPWGLLGLTKVVPGVAGAVWLVARRRWRSVVSGAAVTVTVVAVSWLAAPSQWRDWLTFLRDGASPADGDQFISSPALSAVLLCGGVTVALVGALTSRAWLLAVSVILLSPTIGLNTLTVLAALPRLALPRLTETPCGVPGRRSRQP